MSQKTKAQLITAIDALYTDCGIQCITVNEVNTFEKDKVDSYAGQVIDITKAALATAITNSTIEIGTRYRITDAAQGVIWVYGVDANVISTNAQLEGDYDGSTFAGSGFGTYNLELDKFSGTIIDNAIASGTPDIYLPNQIGVQALTTLGSGCIRNVIGNYAIATLGDNCTDNLIENGASVTFGNGASANKIECGTANLIFGENAAGNTVGLNVNGIIIGDGALHNVFKNGCTGFTFGNNLQNVTVEPGTGGADLTASPAYDFLYGNSYSARIYNDTMGGLLYEYSLAGVTTIVTL